MAASHEYLHCRQLQWQVSPLLFLWSPRCFCISEHFVHFKTKSCILSEHFVHFETKSCISEHFVHFKTRSCISQSFVHFETKCCISEHFVQKQILNVLYSLFSSFFKLFTLPDHCTGAEPSPPFAPYPGQVLYSVRKWCIGDLLHFSVLFIHCDGVDSARYLAHKDI